MCEIKGILEFKWEAFHLLIEVQEIVKSSALFIINNI
jgi:hypothetical protein